MKLSEQYRPKQWIEIVGQDKALSKIEILRARGLSGRAYWFSGSSGTGKTSIAKLLADEVSDDWSTTEYDGGEVDTAVLDALERDCRQRPFGRGVAYIFNEAHGLRAPIIRRLLVLLDSPPAWVTVIFTTTIDGQDKLFEDCDDSHPLLSRCEVIQLARRDLAKPFAERARAIAVECGMDGKPIGDYVKLLQDCKNNLREALSRIELGAMMAKGGAE